MTSSALRPPNHPTKTIRKKKTRDLPNLSDCHACERRTSSTNPSERLRILTSRWRIVLLCKSCLHLVQFSSLCSYCLSDQPGPVYNCRKCLRQIHTSCSSRYSAFPPFSFLPDADSSVCIDCWMPKLMDSRRKEEVGVDSCSPGVSRVSDCQEKAKEPLIAEAAAVEPLHDKRLALQLHRAMNSRRKVEVDSCSPGVSDAQEKAKEPLIAEAAVVEPSHDKRLALQLHRVMNSSPRIARGLLLSSSCCATSSKVVEAKEESSRIDRNMMQDYLNAAETRGNAVDGKSESCDEDVVEKDGGRGPECNRFFRKYYSRRTASNSQTCGSF